MQDVHLDSVKTFSREYAAAKQALNFFDAACWTGQQAAPEFRHVARLEDLAAELGHYGIPEAAVTHLAQKDYDVQAGNAMLLDQIRPFPNLAGVITLLPTTAGELGDIGAYLDQCIAQGARLARLFPTLHRFSLAEWSCGEVLRALQERRMPLVIWHSEASWDALWTMAGKYPELPIVIEGTEGTGRKIMYFDRFYYGLLRDHANVHLELHNLCNFLLIEDMVERFGAGRLVFGSYYPLQDPNATLMRVTHAQIAEADKRRIAGDNLRALIAGVRHGA